jgi:hypothetical protein
MRLVGEVCFRSDLTLSFGQGRGVDLEEVETDMSASFDIGRHYRAGAAARPRGIREASLARVLPLILAPRPHEP